MAVDKIEVGKDTPIDKLLEALDGLANPKFGDVYKKMKDGSYRPNLHNKVPGPALLAKEVIEVLVNAVKFYDGAEKNYKEWLESVQRKGNIIAHDALNEANAIAAKLEPKQGG